MSTNSGYVAYELRDGLLQDLVAVALLIEAARRALRDGEPDAQERSDALLAQAAEALEADLSALRSVIDRLRPAA